MIVKNFANLRFQLWTSACDQSRPPTCQISPAAGDGIKQLFIRQLLKPNQPIYQLSSCDCDVTSPTWNKIQTWKHCNAMFDDVWNELESATLREAKVIGSLSLSISYMSGGI